MPLNIKPSNFKYLILGAGGLGIALRALLYATGTDVRGLLIRGHWAEIGLWLVTAATILGIFLLTRPVTGPRDYEKVFPKSPSAALGCLAAAAGILLNIRLVPGGTMLEMLEPALAGIAAVSMVALAICRFTGRKPMFLFHCFLCVYLAVRMVGQYRQWSAIPQLQDYVFYLGAHVALMLTAYQQAAFDGGMGNHRLLWAWSLGSVYLCCLSLVGEGQKLLPLCFGIWAYTNLSRLRSRHREEYSLQPEETADDASEGDADVSA